jgi:V8-like Glu-specific endopeptidase
MTRPASARMTHTARVPRRWASGTLVVLMVAALVGLLPSSAAAATPDPVLVSDGAIGSSPYQSVVLVAVGGSVACTGFVIGVRRVATAAHCLTRDAEDGDYRLRRGLPTNIQLYRGWSQAAGGQAFPTCRGWRAWAHPRFIRRGPSDASSGERDFDYAVITTPPGCVYPRSAILRLWPTTFQDGQLAVGQTITMAGYPSDSRFGPAMNGLSMWRSRGRLQSSFGDPRRLNVTGFVGHGMSGAAIWRTFRRASPCGKRQCVVGILTECAVNGQRQCRLGDSFRRGVRVTRQVKRDLRTH